MATTLHVAEQTSSLTAGAGHRGLPRPLLPWLLIGFAGLLFIAASLLWRIWTGDALRSIGVLFPIISIVLILRVWNRLGWETRGNWWGLLPLLYAAIMLRQGGNAIQALAVPFRGVVFSLLPLGLTVFAFGSGVVLLLGGVRLWRAALFPLLLLLFVNPVPKAFADLDLPLQYFCARVAHSFALAIGVHPDVDQLRMMFAPDFGMFIAPGCNGIRGAVTMGYLALVLGYLYRFSRSAWTLSVMGAVALGYVFNLVRLCFLVIFYRVALAFPSLQPHGEGADYLIGGLLFLSAAVMFTSVVRWSRRDSDQSAGAEPQSISSPRQLKTDSLRWKGLAVSAVVVLAAFSCLPGLQAMVREKTDGDTSAPLAAAILPQQIGQYKLLRTWSDRDWLNHLAYHWGAYSAGGSADEIDIAFWLGPGVHYPIACHLSQGEMPDWRQVTTLPAAQGSATFDLNFYQDTGGQTLEAATVCDQGGCTEHVRMPSRTGLVFAGMGLKDLFFQPASRPLPVLIRMHSAPAASGGSDALRTQMLNQFQDFISQVDTNLWMHFAQSRRAQ